MSNVIKFQDKRKLETILQELNHCLNIVNALRENLHDYKKYIPVSDLLYQASDTRSYIIIHINRIKGQLEE